MTATATVESTTTTPEAAPEMERGQSTDLGGGLFVYTSPELGMQANSLYAITSEGPVVIDSQFLTPFVGALREDIRKQTERPVRLIVNSHHHADHVLGNRLLADPGTEMLASYLTARLIDATAVLYHAYFKSFYGDLVPAGFQVPTSTYVRSKHVWLGSTVMQLFEFADGATVGGEAVDMTMAWFPQQRVLFTSDALMGHVHGFVSDGTSVPDWLVQLGQLRALVQELQPRVIVPGHGVVGDASLIDEQERYLRTMRRLLNEYTQGGESRVAEADAPRLRQAIVDEFPTFGNQLVLDISLPAFQDQGPLGLQLGWPDSAPAPRTPALP